MLRPAAFLDRDGVINIDHGYTYRREDFAFVPGVLEAAAKLAAAGLTLVVVTNQSGIGRRLYSLQDFERLTDWMRDQFAAAGAPIAGVYYCPHHPTDAVGADRRECDCRKPAPGLLLQAQRELDLDLARSILFGDKRSDMEAAQAAGVSERILLGLNGRAVPVDASLPAGLVTGRYASLLDAVQALAPRWTTVQPGRATA
jgi:D-glycero-D-manno-heptose 1,7-bisphosphate phosphatase